MHDKGGEGIEDGMVLKEKYLAIAVVLLLSSLMTSCIAYRPQVAEMPLIHEKGELQMNGGDAGPITDGRNALP